jgi:hypothetical protein
MFKLIWNKKYALAEAKIDELNADYANENWLLPFLTLAIYRSNFKDSVKYYSTILRMIQII